MTSAPRLVAFAGSTRKASLNRRLIAAAAEIARAQGADVELLELSDYAMPLFDQDLEAEGTPDAAIAFKRKLEEADGFLIASPEYNSSYPPVLKNAIDWASRPEEGKAMLSAFAGKACGLLAASPGALGGIRMLPQLRTLLMNIGVFVAPKSFGLGKAHEAFAEDGSLADERTRGQVEGVVAQTIELASR